jgi:ribosomal protein L11 methyltransferase
VSWLHVRVSAVGDRPAVLRALFAAGAQGVHEDGEALVTHLAPGADAEAIRVLLTAADGRASVETVLVEPLDWTERWKDRVRAHDLGRLTIAPPWLAAALDPATTIVVEPAMAFGTGEHATTRGVVRLLQQAIRPGDRVADLGAGSAVLAIAAAKLGASRVAAIEIDPDAIGNADENVERNGVADRVTVIEGDAAVLLPLVAPVSLVLANIISSVLKELLPAIADALSSGGRAILSGILLEERAEMLDVLGDNGWRAEREDAEDIWWSVLISRA